MIRPIPSAALKQLEAAKAEHKRGNFDQARRLYRRLLKKHPKLTHALHFLGVLEHMAGQSKKGLELVERARQQDPRNYDIRKNLGNILNDLNRSEEAEAIYRVLIEERPADPGNHSNHCTALRKLGRFDEAIAAGKRAVELAPDQPAGWHALANALSSAGDLNQSVAAYEKVLAMAPEFSPAHNSLCQVLLQLEQRGWLSRRRLRRTRAAYGRWVRPCRITRRPGSCMRRSNRVARPSACPTPQSKANFDAYAGHFDRHIHSLDYRGPEFIAEVMSRRLPAPHGKLEVLDGGCGTGLSGHALRPHAKRLIGVDLSTSMLDRAQATGLYDDLQEAELGQFLLEHPKTFDLCTFVDVLIYFGSLNEILSRAARALRPGGLLAFPVEKSSPSPWQPAPSDRAIQLIIRPCRSRWQQPSAGDRDARRRASIWKRMCQKGLIVSVRSPPPMAERRRCPWAPGWTTNTSSYQTGKTSTTSRSHRFPQPRCWSAAPNVRARKRQ